MATYALSFGKNFACLEKALVRLPKNLKIPENNAKFYCPSRKFLSGQNENLERSSKFALNSSGHILRLEVSGYPEDACAHVFKKCHSRVRIRGLKHARDGV